MTARTITLSLLLLGFSVRDIRAQASPIRFEHLTMSDGLSQDIVTSIAQDHDGFIWIGTEDGLNRFDGHTCDVYKNIPGDTSSLSASWIRVLHVARDGTLWIGAGGLHRYDPETDTFVRIHLGVETSFQTSAFEVFALEEDTLAGLWVGTTAGLFHLDHHQEILQRFTHDEFPSNSLSSSIVLSLHLGSNGLLWIGTNHGLDALHLPSRTVVHSDTGNLAFTAASVVQSFCASRDGSLWFSVHQKGIARLNPANRHVDRYQVADISFALTEDSHGRLWVGHDKGLSILDPDTRTVTSVKHNEKDPRSVAAGRVYALLKDRAGTVWVGTDRNGVSRYDPQRNRFGLFRQSTIDGGQTWDDQIYSVLEEKPGLVWLGTSRGLEYFDLATGRLQPAPNPVPPIGRRPSSGVLSLLKDREGLLWVGYREGRNLERIDLHRGTVKRYPFPDVRTIFQDRDGDIWIGFWLDGVVRLDPSSGTSTFFRTQPEFRDSLHGGGVWSIHEDGEGKLWMGTWAGGGTLNVFDKTTGKFSHVGIAGDQTDHKAGINVRAIVEESDGSLWLGTWGNGLQRYTPHSDNFDFYYEQDGLPNNFIKGLIHDGSGHLWISTERGLCRRDQETGQFRTYTTADGVQGDRFLSGSFHRGQSGMMYFGGEEGLTFFYPDDITDDATPPPVVITGFRIFDKTQSATLWHGGTIQLDYDQDFISFEFVALDYTDPTRNQFAYILEGFDRDWIEAGPRRYAAYTHLDGGEYTFRVRASNNDGIWNLQGATLKVTVRPPFWKTWWFYSGLTLAGLFTILTAFRLRLRRHIAMERLRQRIASDLHDDVGTELSSIVLASQYLARTLPLELGDKAKIENLGSLARSAHEMMRDIVWVLRTDNDMLDELVVKMREVAARLLSDTTFQFEAPSRRSDVRIPLEIKRNLFLFYKEALNNIVRHSGATSVTIRMTYADHSIGLSIIDNGRGFDDSRTTPGVGLRSLRERAKSMGTTVNIESHQGGGTIISLSVRAT